MLKMHTRTGVSICTTTTCSPLLRELKKRGHSSTGTIRSDRIPRSAPILSKETLKKQDRGAFTYATNGEIIVSRWKDNAVVTMISNAHTIFPLQKAKRYSRIQKGTVEIQQPGLVCDYNQNMGGTDSMDQSINCYRIGIRSKKWWWCIFSWLLNASVNNAWILFK